MHVKAVLIIGDYVTKTNTQDWVLTVGHNSNPLLNPKIFDSSAWAILNPTLATQVWAKEV